MGKLRVIQWTTGKVGKLALRGILDDPRLELVGVYAYSDSKSGTDAGELCGRRACGVKATNDLNALLALKADAVLYTPFMADLEHVTQLLANGCNVVSTNLFLNLGGISGDTKTALENACKTGNSSLFITGVNPGWINSTAAALTAVCRDVTCVTIEETANCAVYESAETWQAMGMGVPEATPQVLETVRLWLTSFYDSTQRLAEALNYELDDMEFFADFATASETVDLGWFCMPQNTNAAIRAGWRGKIKGRTVVQTKVAWYLTPKLNEDWTFHDDQYQLIIDGEPSLNTRIRFIPPEHWGNHEWDTMTAMPAVNALLDVQAAPSGILTLKDVGLVSAPAGLWVKD